MHEGALVANRPPCEDRELFQLGFNSFLLFFRFIGACGSYVRVFYFKYSVKE